MTAKQKITGQRDLTFDMDAARAARAEAVGDPFPFTFGGQAFTIPSPKEWPIEATGSLAVGDVVAAMRLLLGEQYEAFTLHKPTLADVEDLLGAVAKWQGISLGE